MLYAGVATAAVPCQQRRAAGAAQGGPLPVKKEEGRPDLKKARHGILKLEERESRGSRDGGNNQIRDFIRDGGENPILENGVKLKPFTIVVGDRDDGAVKIAMEVEPSCKKKEQAAPLFIVWLRKTELDRDM
ncbi:unnamed protein product [Cuscuta campestris]|uniref:Uncharacterized protein n=1 Tax=Cuscuta campestris TaxID=132261 RepID=A0A484N7E2_9ASTE|nr:unnamed protein product [Cuscuta campestris]